jgi:hypothetical protein
VYVDLKRFAVPTDPVRIILMVAHVDGLGSRRDFAGRQCHLDCHTSNAIVAGNGKTTLSQLLLLFVLNWLHSHWHSVHWGDASAYIGIVVTAFFGFLSWRSSRRSKTAKDEAETAKGEAKAAEAEAKAQAERAERATKAAEEAAAAAGQAVVELRRSATAQETHTALLQDAAEQAERFPWDIIRMGDSMDFRLVNLTNARKYEVVVTGEPVQTGRSGVFRPGGGGSNQFDVVDGRDTVELDLFVALQTQDRSVTIHWRPTRDHTGDPWTQRRGLP